MSLPAKRRATYQDLLAVPSHMVAEIIDGELTTSPRPAPRYALASSRLGGVLDGPFDRGTGGPGGWIILDEALACGATVVLTGDKKDFGRYVEKPDRTEGVLIVTVARFIDAYLPS